MAQSFTGKKRIRKSFGRIPEAVQMPNLIEVQRSSYEQFLQRETRPADRRDEGIEAVFKSVFPIKDFNERAVLEYVSYEFEEPKYDVEECIQRDMTYAAPLKVKLRLIVFETDEETGARSVKDIKEQDVYMGDIPLMTDKGTFIVNGTERVIVSQMHRSPGVFFDHDKGKTHASGKLLFAARIIPYRGSWLDFEFDAKDIVYVRIDRRRKLPATTFLYGLGMDGEEILTTFYDVVPFEKREGARGWATALQARALARREAGVPADRRRHRRGSRPGRPPRSPPATAKKFADAGLKTLLLAPEALIGRYLARDEVNYADRRDLRRSRRRAGRRPRSRPWKSRASPPSTCSTSTTSRSAPTSATPCAWTRTPSARTRCSTSTASCVRASRRRWKPPRPCSSACSSTRERYDLSSVGRVKMNMRLELDCPDDVRVLRKEDVLEVLQDPGRPARRPRRNRRHRQPRQPPGPFGRRAAGKPVPRRPAAHGAGDQGAHVARSISTRSCRTT